ncbi:hypothetical protein KY285_030119 [Solanum tuberosum]|nr:hypothetical protein KY285_030119 [Solanum tuberosum]
MHKSGNILRKVVPDWNHCLNYPMAYTGWVWLLRRAHIQVHVLVIHEQYVHCKVSEANGNFSAYLTVIYANNESQNREEMWRDLVQIGRGIQKSWLLCGDFNNVLATEDRTGSPVLPGETQAFQGCIDTLQLTALRQSGRHFTCCHRQQDGSRVHSKIDWAFRNFQWTVNYGHVEVEFLSPGVSDHSPIVIQVSTRPPSKPKSFGLFKTVLEHPEFEGILTIVWNKRYTGTRMRQLWSKLKAFK